MKFKVKKISIKEETESRRRSQESDFSSQFRQINVPKRSQIG